MRMVKREHAVSVVELELFAGSGLVNGESMNLQLGSQLILRKSTTPKPAFTSPLDPTKQYKITVTEV
jgi:hypothetical protein